MKKLLLTLGAMTSIAAPIAAVISCNEKTDDTTKTDETGTPDDKDTTGGTDTTEDKDTTDKETPTPEEFKATNREMLNAIGGEGLDKLIGVTDGKYYYTPFDKVADEDKVALKAFIEDDTKAKSLVGDKTFNTKAEFDAFIDNATMAEAKTVILANAVTFTVVGDFGMSSLYKLSVSKDIANITPVLTETQTVDEVKAAIKSVITDAAAIKLLEGALAHGETTKDFFNMLKFLRTSSSMQAFAAQEIGVDPKVATNKGKSAFAIVIEKVLNGFFDSKKSATDIISKFAGEDSDFVAGTVAFAATVDQDAKTLTPGMGWIGAMPFMGGSNEVVEYILSTIGYTLVTS